MILMDLVLKCGPGAGITVSLGRVLTPMSGCLMDQLHPNTGLRILTFNPQPTQCSLLMVVLMRADAGRDGRQEEVNSRLVTTQNPWLSWFTGGAGSNEIRVFNRETFVNVLVGS